MSYTTIPHQATDLTELISNHSLVGSTGPISHMGAPVNQEGTDEWNRGLSAGPVNSAPFHDNNASTDHIKDLLTKDAESSRLNASSPAQSPQYMGPGPAGDLDLEGGTPGVFTIGLGQNDGKKLNGKDLHVELMQGSFTYTHGTGTVWASSGTSGASPGAPGNSVFFKSEEAA